MDRHALRARDDEGRLGSASSNRPREKGSPWKIVRNAASGGIFVIRRFTLAEASRWAALWMLQCKKSMEIG